MPSNYMNCCESTLFTQIYRFCETNIEYWNLAIVNVTKTVYFDETTFLCIMYQKYFCMELIKYSNFSIGNVGKCCYFEHKLMNFRLIYIDINIDLMLQQNWETISRIWYTHV